MWKKIEEFDGDVMEDYLVVTEGVIYVAYLQEIGGDWITEYKAYGPEEVGQVIKPDWFMEIPEIPGDDAGEKPTHELFREMRDAMDKAMDLAVELERRA